MSMSNQKSTDVVIKNLEMQVGQFLKHKGNFPANTQDNPREQCKAIQTRSGREIDTGVGVEVKKENVEVENEKEIDVREGEKNVEKEVVEKELIEKDKIDEEEEKKS